MKSFFILLFLCSSIFIFSQSDYEKDWQEVYQYELDGKTRSAFENVQNIYKKAKRKKEETQIIKCFFYLSKFTQVLEEEAQSKIIPSLKKEIQEGNTTSKAILNYVYPTLLKNYVNYNQYKICQRIQTAS